MSRRSGQQKCYVPRSILTCNSSHVLSIRLWCSYYNWLQNFIGFTACQWWEFYVTPFNPATGDQSNYYLNVFLNLEYKLQSTECRVQSDWRWWWCWEVVNEYDEVIECECAAVCVWPSCLGDYSNINCDIRILGD